MTSPLIGHAEARGAFASALAGGKLHHAWLLAGPQGVGKARFAEGAALDLLAGVSGNREHAAAMIAAGSHPDYRVVTRGPADESKPDGELARSIKIKQIRALGHMLAVKPSMGPARAVVIDAIDDLEPPAANALLKSLEEPPAGTIFFLVSHAPGRLLPTVRSRCRLLRFEPLPPHEMSAVLGAELPEAGADEIAALIGLGAGSPGRALRFAGLDLAAIERELAAIADTGDADSTRRGKLAKILSAKAAQPRYEAFLERAPALIAERAARQAGPALATALDAYDAAVDLARASLGLSLDAQTTVFEMGGLVARLAPAERSR